MQFFKTKLLGLILLCPSSICFAEPLELGRINIELFGEVVVSTCGVFEEKKYVDLGHYASNDLAHVGAKTPAVPIVFRLSNCLPGIPVSFMFSGSKNAVDAELLAIEPGAEAAQNIAIEILDQDKKRLALEHRSQGLIANLTGDITATFYANYIVTQAAAKAGKANASAQFVIQYD